jgi:hypothetical protein
MAGGNFELHYYDAYGQGGTVTIHDLEPMLDDMRRARTFLESLPFYEMEPCNELLPDDTNYCLAKPGEVYAIYMPNGGSATVDLSDVSGEFETKWFNPRTGDVGQHTPTVGGDARLFEAPTQEDWALVIEN